MYLLFLEEGVHRSSGKEHILVRTCKKDAVSTTILFWTSMKVMFFVLLFGSEEVQLSLLTVPFIACPGTEVGRNHGFVLKCLIHLCC